MKTKTIKGKDLENVQRLVTIALDKLNQGGRPFPDDKVGFTVVDRNVKSITINY